MHAHGDKRRRHLSQREEDARGANQSCQLAGWLVNVLLGGQCIAKLARREPSRAVKRRVARQLSQSLGRSPTCSHVVRAMIAIARTLNSGAQCASPASEKRANAYQNRLIAVVVDSASSCSSALPLALNLHCVQQQLCARACVRARLIARLSSSPHFLPARGQ